MSGGHFKIRIGNWMFENWHLYHYVLHKDAKSGTNKWFMWDRVL